MEFGYEERSMRLIERLDRIQNYLQSLPPLPKIGSLSRTGEQSKDLSELGGSNSSSESGDSAGSSTTDPSVTIRLSKPIPKDECACDLLQQSPSSTPPAFPSPDVSRTTTGGPSPAHSQYELTKMKNKKNRRRDNKVKDPLKPTTRTSFGVDIGQGINVINYIKQNAVLGSDAKNKRLAGIIAKGAASAVQSEKSIERAQKQGPLTMESSSSSIHLKNKEAVTTKFKPSGGHKLTGFGSTPSPKASETDIYRVRYQVRAIELPHHHGLDGLQELFVPYMEHDCHPDLEPCRNESYE